MDDLQGAILALLRRNPGGLLPGRIREELGLGRGESRQLRRTLLRMLEEERLQRHRGRFLLPGLVAERSGRRRPRQAVPATPPESLELERSRGMEQLLAEYGLEPGFPPAVLAETENQAARDPFQRGARRSLDGLFILCIDPEDARDHDDALSLEPLPGGGRRLGVHIADVAQYVREGGLLDEEARRRGNSTYFYLDTVPMLPPRLSGELCSLLEDRERPAVSVFIDYDARGRVAGREIVETRLRVGAGISYERADALLEREGELADRLRALLALAVHLRGERAGEGAIQFELPERIPLERDGELEGFGPAAILRSHTIVEECMLAANREVARFLRERGVKTLHRIHEEPDEDDVLELQALLARRGVHWKPARPVGSEDYRRLALSLAGRPDRERLLFRMLRSLKRAAYSPARRGHFGLAWDDYLHFTSPIRRYADLLVHRQVKALLREQRLPRADGLASLGEELTEAETRSMEAEREGLRLEMVLWARRRLGEVFEAEIQAVLNGGLVVRLPDSGVEGFVPAAILGDEWFEFEAERERLRGERTGRIYESGGILRLRLVDANLFTRRIHFFLEEAP